MKRAKIVIDEKGNYEIDLVEGFSGTSCAQKAKELQIIIGGKEDSENKKTEYFDSDGDNLNEIFNGK